jgi:hypothetical protein
MFLKKELFITTAVRTSSYVETKALKGFLEEYEYILHTHA